MHDYIPEQLECQKSNNELTATCLRSRKQRSIDVFICTLNAKRKHLPVKQDKKHDIVYMY